LFVVLKQFRGCSKATLLGASYHCFGAVNDPGIPQADPKVIGAED
jgi:hypothetical protein